MAKVLCTTIEEYLQGVLDNFSASLQQIAGIAKVEIGCLQAAHYYPTDADTPYTFSGRSGIALALNDRARHAAEERVHISEHPPLCMVWNLGCLCPSIVSISGSTHATINRFNLLTLSRTWVSLGKDAMRIADSANPCFEI